MSDAHKTPQSAVVQRTPVATYAEVGEMLRDPALADLADGSLKTVLTRIAAALTYGNRVELVVVPDAERTNAEAKAAGMHPEGVSGPRPVTGRGFGGVSDGTRR
jgi:hypothetical protein